MLFYWLILAAVFSMGASAAQVAPDCLLNRRVVTPRVLLRHTGIEALALRYELLPRHGYFWHRFKVFVRSPFLIDAVDRKQSAVPIRGNQLSEVFSDPASIEARLDKSVHALTVAEQHNERNASPGSGISESARLVNRGLPQSLQGASS